MRLQDVGLSRIYESLTDPRLYKADHCCLSLSRALAFCSCFQLCCMYINCSYFCLPDIEECGSNPCVNNGTCIDGVNGFTCNCTREFGGDRSD